eukprot:7580917-Alexandrium_andersonii.AAC.1
MVPDESGVRPLTNRESPTRRVRAPSMSRWGSKAALATGMAGRGIGTIQAPSRSVAVYAVMAESGPADPS